MADGNCSLERGGGPCEAWWRGTLAIAQHRKVRTSGLYPSTTLHRMVQFTLSGRPVGQPKGVVPLPVPERIGA